MEFLAGAGNYGPIVINAETLGEAWEHAVIAIMTGGVKKFVDAPDYKTNTIESQMFLYIKNPFAEPRIHPSVALPLEQAQEYANNVIYGMPIEKENKHDYTYFSRLRRHRECPVIVDLPNIVEGAELKKAANEICNGQCKVELLDQVQKVIDTLKDDPSRRSCVMHTWYPLRDLEKFGPRAKTSSPCLVTMQPQIIDGRLHMIATMKTNDLYSAWPLNAFAFTELQKYIAKEVGVETGSYTHFSVSMQIYEEMFEMAQELVDNPILTKGE
ncbi:MAG: thymidylate synthase [Candidatus Aenigmatarchaeota archaeon]